MNIMNDYSLIKERYDDYIPYKAASPNPVLTQLLRTLALAHDDIGKLLQMVGELEIDNERLAQDRYDALSVYSKDGLLSSEWILRTGKAERKVKELQAKLDQIEERRGVL